jgi:hypothetical protein
MYNWINKFRRHSHISSRVIKQYKQVTIFLDDFNISYNYITEMWETSNHNNNIVPVQFKYMDDALDYLSNPLVVEGGQFPVDNRVVNYHARKNKL